MPLPGSALNYLRAPPQIRTRPFRASGSSDLRFRYTVGVNDSSWWKVEVPVEHGYVPRPRHLGLTSGSPAEPFVPSEQHLVPNTGNGTAVTNDSVIGIVSLQLLAELSVLFVNGLVPVLPTPERHSTKRPALLAAGGFAHYVPLSFARSAPVVGEARKSKVAASASS
jgi:hypothetical protein